MTDLVTWAELGGSFAAIGGRRLRPARLPGGALVHGRAAALGGPAVGLKLLDHGRLQPDRRVVPLASTGRPGDHPP